jgi:hypothetical protein
MSCLGVHFAIGAAKAERLILAANDAEILLIVQDEIEARLDDEWLYQTDKAWDAIHRCLTDGRLTLGNGEYPLNYRYASERRRTPKMRIVPSSSVKSTRYSPTRSLNASESSP